MAEHNKAKNRENTIHRSAHAYVAALSRNHKIFSLCWKKTSINVFVKLLPRIYYKLVKKKRVVSTKCSIEATIDKHGM